MHQRRKYDGHRRRFFLLQFLQVRRLRSPVRVSRRAHRPHRGQSHRFMTDAARREQETMKKKVAPKLSLSITGGVSRNSTATPPRHTSGNLTPPVTPPITPSSSFRSSTPTGSEYDEEELHVHERGEEKPFACPVPGCKKRYKNVNGIKYHAKNGHRTQIRVRKPFKCRCGKSYKTSQGLRHHTINFHPPVSTEILRKIQG
ncbi:hypothetical protein KUCAC02_011002 [Chaenocephalus aceratus]|uniref:Uncharacterized protein n=1 Tax=Chaenocephalus aceratus TaxID=36190 RepID=A0ACB9WWB8_CHAAC|nr:hypothetical protein KUCAC02_011002 [Chaenocephalus aceratus]